MKSVFVAYLSLALGLPAALVITLAVRHRIRSRRALRDPSPRVPVADIMARVAIERAAERGTPRIRRPATALPRGRVWPDRDQDAMAYSVTVPIQHQDVAHSVTVPIQRRVSPQAPYADRGISPGRRQRVVQRRHFLRPVE